ncbi:MAG: hypothetical protein ACTFAL_06005 [Candidatus Electronema sp. V4]|uniref:hypothetical protein n=1 Tax=Candidatus Electronema sp. V4 TaxID=3454756 RepID=UPI0040559926
MSCRALGIAAHDLAGGVAMLKRLQQERQLAWLSMNLVEAGSRQPVFPSWLLTEIAGLPVAVLGLTGGPAMLDAAPDKADYAVLPWQDVLPETLKQAGGKAAMVILLSSYPDAVNKEIAAAYPGLHLVLASGPGTAASHPSLVGGTLFAQTGAQGKTLGLLRITWTEAGKWEDKQLAGENLCRFSAQLIPLESSLPEDPAVRDIMRRTSQQQAAAGKNRRGD